MGNAPKAKETAVQVLLLDLYVAWREDPDLLIGVSMETGAYKANSRYNKLHISDQLRDVIRYLEKINLIGLHLGEKAQKIYRIWPTQELGGSSSRQNQPADYQPSQRQRSHRLE